MIKIFIQNAVSFDFAFLTDRFGPKGQSFYLDVILKGKINSTGMLIDFSHAKKIVKSIVKDFDHKLLVSKKHVKHVNRSHIIVFSSSQISDAPQADESDDSQQKAVNFFGMHANRSWVKVVDDLLLKSLDNNETAAFEDYIAKQISEHMPNNITHVFVRLKGKSEHSLHIDTKNIFHYTHTLCDHPGNCQRFHGHSAQVQVFNNKLLDEKLSLLAVQKMKGLYIVSKQHLCPLFQSVNLEKVIKYCFQPKHFEIVKNDLHAFEYKGSLGKVSIIISRHLTVLLPHESTIESITQYIYEHVSGIQNESHTQEASSDAASSFPTNIKVCVYEGLSKGAVIE